MSLKAHYLSLAMAYGSKSVKAWIVNEWFSIHRGEIGGWNVTHRLTGYSAAQGIRSKKSAERLARQLVTLKRSWDFTDIKESKKWPKAKRMCQQAQASR